MAKKDYQELVDYVKNPENNNLFDLRSNVKLTYGNKKEFYLTVYNEDYPLDPEIKYEFVDSGRYGTVDYLVINSRKYGTHTIRTGDLPKEVQEHLNPVYKSGLKIIKDEIKYRDLLKQSETSKEGYDAINEFRAELRNSLSEHYTINDSFEEDLYKYLDANYLNNN